jgi:hypothetical protein
MRPDQDYDYDYDQIVLAPVPSCFAILALLASQDKSGRWSEAVLNLDKDSKDAYKDIKRRS